MLIGYPVIVVSSNERRIGRIVSEFDGEFYEVEFPGEVREKMLPKSICPMIRSHFIMHQLQISSAFVTYMQKYHGQLNKVKVRHSCTLRVRAIKSFDTYARLSGDVLVLFDSVSTSLEYGFLDEKVKDESIVDVEDCLSMHLNSKKVTYNGKLKSKFIKVIDELSGNIVYFKNEREWYRIDTHVIDAIATQPCLLEVLKKNMWASGESSNCAIAMNYEPQRGFMYIFTESDVVFNIISLEWPLAYLNFATNNDAMELRMRLIDDSYIEPIAETDYKTPKLGLLPEIPYRYGQKKILMSSVTKSFREARSGKYVNDVQLENMVWLPIFWLHVQFLIYSNIISQLQDRKFHSKSMLACERMCINIFKMFQIVSADLWWKPKDALRIARQNIYSGYMNEQIDQMIRIFESDSIAFCTWAGNLNSMLLIYGKCEKPRPVNLELDEENDFLKIDDIVFFSAFMHPFQMKSITKKNLMADMKPLESRFKFDNFEVKKKKKKKKSSKSYSSPQSIDMDSSFANDSVEATSNASLDTSSLDHASFDKATLDNASFDKATLDDASLEAISPVASVQEEHMGLDEFPQESLGGTLTFCEPYVDNSNLLEKARDDQNYKEVDLHEKNVPSVSCVEIGTMTTSSVLLDTSVQTLSPLMKTASVMTDDYMYENVSDNMQVLNQRHNKDTQALRQFKAKHSKDLESLRLLKAKMAGNDAEYQKKIKRNEVCQLEDKACIERLEVQKLKDAATVKELKVQIDAGLKEIEALKTNHAKEMSLMATMTLSAQGDAATEIERLTLLLKSKEDELLNVSEKTELWKLRCNSMSTLDMHHGAAIIQQVVFYFSDQNLQYDGFLVSCMQKHPEGFVHLEWVANFQRLQALHVTPILLSGLLHNAIGIEFDANQSAIRCSHGRWRKYVGAY